MEQDTADRLAILNLIARYTNVVDAGDVEALSALFAEEGRFVTQRDGRAVSFAGRDAFPAFVRGNLANEPDAMSIHFHGQVEFRSLTGERATTSTRALLGWSRRSAPAAFIAGTYNDTFVKRSGQWLILEREFRSDESVITSRAPVEGETGP